MLNYNAFTMTFSLRYLSSCLNILFVFVNISCILIIILVVFFICYGKSYFQITWTPICVSEWQVIWSFFRFGYNLMTLWKWIKMSNWTNLMCIRLYFECFKAWFYLMVLPIGPPIRNHKFFIGKISQNDPPCGIFSPLSNLIKM